MRSKLHLCILSKTNSYFIKVNFQRLKVHAALFLSPAMLSTALRGFAAARAQNMNRIQDPARKRRQASGGIASARKGNQRQIRSYLSAGVFPTVRRVADAVGRAAPRRPSHATSTTTTPQTVCRVSHPPRRGAAPAGRTPRAPPAHRAGFAYSPTSRECLQFVLSARA